MANNPTSTTTASLIAPEAAMALRVIRSEYISRDLFCWLADPTAYKAYTSPHFDQEMQESLAKIITPLRSEANAWEERVTRYADAWLGMICRDAAMHYTELKLEVGPRLLAASLLPLYRCLATGRLREGFSHTRLRLSELLALLSLCYELGDDFVQLLNHGQGTSQSPIATLQADLNLDLAHIAALVTENILGYDDARGELEESYLESLLENAESGCGSHPCPTGSEWAEPELLWRLGGELVSKKAEFVLPRAWIETPVPWNSISDHWRSLTKLLEGVKRTEDCKVSRTQSEPRDVGEVNAGATETPARPASAQFSESVQRLADSHSNKILADAGISSVAEPLSVTAELAAPAQRQNAVKEPCAHEADLPKILIAEIHTHNDPAFVNVVRRQIATCRAENRTISLTSVIVEPEEGSDRDALCGSLDNGLNRWQQALVNWMCEQPEIQNPYAFLTVQGELILCVIDLERNELTQLLRLGLIEVLTGERIQSPGAEALARVKVPARYYAGIASASAPGATFTPEKLIEAAQRCLTAVKHQGKAAIKSIEAY